MFSFGNETQGDPEEIGIETGIKEIFLAGTTIRENREASKRIVLKVKDVRKVTYETHRTDLEASSIVTAQTRTKRTI